MSVTIKEMALELGLSASTVSRALRDDGTISTRTKTLVKKLAASLNYQPNPFALMLRRQRAHSIAVLMPKINHYYFSEMLSAISEEAAKAGYQLVVHQSNDCYEREAKIINNMMDRVDGLITIFSKETKDFSHFNQINPKTPILYIDRANEDWKSHSIITDDYTGAWKATEHLIEQGYSKITYLGTHDELLINEVREQAYLDVMEEHEADSKAMPSIKCDSNTIESAQACMTKILTLPKSERPDAIFANDDMLALGTMMAAKELGMNIPDDLGIVGFGDLSFAPWVTPSLTTVQQSGKAVGTNAARLLLGYLDGKLPHLETKIIETKLIIRDSSRRLT